ncbi:MAG: cob(I)yrinic acid a,c-diamide adenosyltransferase [Coriobacteriales bacterium]|nr:cob(I)yrinic acid a,c-diamide adenosyltransferase [Coriobacteriales bacterium]
MIHVIFGQGKGKTSASVGMAVRAAGHGYPVLFIQFLKDDSSGEIEILRNTPGVTVLHAPVNYGFTFQMSEAQLKETALEYDRLLDAALSSDAFLIVLDEALYALNAGLLSREKLESVAEKNCEVVITGRDAPAWLVDKADYVSYIQNLKHPYDQGTKARAGIEF